MPLASSHWETETTVKYPRCMYIIHIHTHTHVLLEIMNCIQRHHDVSAPGQDVVPYKFARRTQAL